MNNILNYIRQIEEIRGKYLNKYFNAGQIDAIFSEVSKVRKQTADGKTFECKYYISMSDCFINAKVLVKNCGTTFKPTSAICPITNKPMSAKLKQYYVVDIDLSDGINKRIEELKEKYAKVENEIKKQTIPTYEEYFSHWLIRNKMHYGSVGCLSMKELKKFLGKELADGKSIIINNTTVIQLFNEKQISLRLARYLYNYIYRYYVKEIVFNYVDMTNSYNGQVQATKDYIKVLQNQLVEIEANIKEWEAIKGLYS